MSDWVYEERILKVFQEPFKTMMLERGARSTGKSHNKSRQVVLKAHIENVSVLCIRNTLESLEDSTYAEIKGALDELGIKYSSTKSPLRIITSQGVQFLFKGLDKPDKIKSIKAKPRIGIVWFEEATEIQHESAVRKIMMSIREGERWYLFTYNPENPRHFLVDWEKEHGVNITTCFDNPYNDEIFYKELEIIKRTNPREYRKVALGEWVEEGYSVYNLTQENELLEPDVTYPFITIGVDLGENDATTFIATGFRDKLKGVDVLEQYHHWNEKLPDPEKLNLLQYVNEFEVFYKKIKEKYPAQRYQIWVDSASMGSTFISLLAVRGITNIKKVSKKKGSVAEMTQAIKYIVDANVLRVPKNVGLWGALEEASRDPLKPSDHNDYYCKDTGDAHSRDAFKYSIMMHLNILRIPKVALKRRTSNGDDVESIAVVNERGNIEIQ